MGVTQVDHTNQLDKQIAQNDHAKQDDITSRNGNDEMLSDAPEQLRCVWRT